MTREVLWALLARVFLIAAGFISSIITARFLGPDGRGIFFYWTTLAAFAIQFGNLGLHSSNTYFLTKGRAQLSVLAANSLWVSLVGGGFLGGLLIVSLFFTGAGLADRWSLVWPVLVIIPAGLYFLLGTNLLIAESRIGEYSGFELANRYFGLAAILFVAWYWHTPQALLITMSMVTLVMCLPLYRRLRMLGGNGRHSFSLVREGFGYAMRAYLAAVIGFAVLRLSTLLLESFVDSDTLGTWSIAVQLMDVIIVIPSTVALVLLPKIMRSDRPYQLMQSQLGLTAIVLALVCVVVAWLGREVITRIYGERFTGAYIMLLWGLPGAFFLGLTSILSQYLASVGIPLALIWIWLVGLAVELALAIWLIPNHGAIGAMASLSVAYALISGMLGVLAAYHHRLQRKCVDV